MRLEKLEIVDYRNIEKMIIFPAKNINVIYGQNAQGKTNMLEAIWLFSGNNSFKGAKNSELIRFSKEKCILSIEFSDNQRRQKAAMMLSQKKKITLNNVDLKSAGELKGNFFAVVFSPAQLSMITDGPKNRRGFIDIAISAVNPQYKNYLQRYEQILSQRNALLKDSKNYQNIEQSMDIWDLQLAKIGTIISIYRNDYVKKLQTAAKKIYHGMSSQKEEFYIEYISSGFDKISNVTSYSDENVLSYYDKLKKSFGADMKLGFTTVGVHRDDLDIVVEGKSVRCYGSQGQQRSCVVSLKLAEAELLKKITGENPIMLLDDVLSELDEKRQEYLLNHLTDTQVFITCCDISHTINLKDGKIFEIENGQVKE